MAENKGGASVRVESQIGGRCAAIFQGGVLAGHLSETSPGHWTFHYETAYSGEPVSLTLPLRAEPYEFEGFPPVFEGLLPEGPQLESLLRKHKKLSAVLSLKKSCFELVDQGGRFILKPNPVPFREVPANEALTMRMAATVGITAPPWPAFHSR
jgi:serine/threonine-protein kinase HipA